MKFSDVISLPEGPRRTAAIAAWVQGLFSRENRVPVLVGGAAVEILTGGAYTLGTVIVPPLLLCVGIASSIHIVTRFYIERGSAERPLRAPG